MFSNAMEIINQNVALHWKTNRDQQESNEPVDTSAQRLQALFPDER